MAYSSGISIVFNLIVRIEGYAIYFFRKLSLSYLNTGYFINSIIICM